MTHILRATVASLALTIGATQAFARPMTVTVDMASFRGPKAYIAVYVTAPDGRVHDTLYVGGRDSGYYRHLRDWARGASGSQTPIHAVTGASVGSGRTLQVSADLADNLIAAGYQIRVDAAIEDRGDYPRSAILTLGQDSTVDGRGAIRALSIN